MTDGKLLIIKTAYFKCFEASLLNKMDNMKIYFGILNDLYAQNPKEFLSFINEDRFSELKKIKYQVENNMFIEQYSNFIPIEQDISLTTTEIEKEFDIVKKVYRDPVCFEKFLQPELVRKGIERRLNGKKNPDRCDLILQGGRTMYPIEFKLGKATHAVVGQIDKYCREFKLRLIYELYDKVQGVVVANSYSQFAANELKKKEYIGIIHSGPLENIRFSRLF